MTSEAERIVRYTAEELAEKRRRGETLSNWEKVDALTEEELEASIDFEEEGEFDWDVVYLARGFERIEGIVTFRCDYDLFEWFQEHSDNLEAEIGRVLTACTKEQRNRGEY